jgi:hypothetical protein
MAVSRSIAAKLHKPFVRSDQFKIRAVRLFDEFFSNTVVFFDLSFFEWSFEMAVIFRKIAPTR